MPNHHISKSNNFFHVIKPIYFRWAVRKRHNKGLLLPNCCSSSEKCCHQHINQFPRKPNLLYVRWPNPIANHWLGEPAEEILRVPLIQSTNKKGMECCPEDSTESNKQPSSSTERVTFIYEMTFQKTKCQLHFQFNIRRYFNYVASV